MTLGRIKKELIRELADVVRARSFRHPIRHTKAVSSALRSRLKSGKPLSPTAKKLLLASATGPAVYTTAAAAGAVRLKKSMDKKASTFRSFYDELEKIAALSPLLKNYVSRAKVNPIEALRAIGSDKPAQREALAIVRKLRREGNLPKSLLAAPVPKGDVATFGEKVKGISWASLNLPKSQVRGDLRAVLASLK